MKTRVLFVVALFVFVFNFLQIYSKWTFQQHIFAAHPLDLQSLFLPVTVRWAYHSLSLVFTLQKHCIYRLALCFFLRLQQSGDVSLLMWCWKCLKGSVWSDTSETQVCGDATRSISLLIYFFFLSLHSLCSQEACQTGVRWGYEFLLCLPKVNFCFSVQPLPAISYLGMWEGRFCWNDFELPIKGEFVDFAESDIMFSQKPCES